MHTLLIALLLAANSAQSTPAGDDPVAPDFLTVAEKSGFRATARYDEVLTLLERLTDSSPLVRRTEMGHTVEGRAIPVLVIADPPVATPADAMRQVAERDKLIVLAIGNIHAGEVDGKEALPMIARELIQTPRHPLRDDLIVLLAPIYNADGNERVSKDNRPGQVGPAEGMGRRENAAGLDLNRDFIKLEAPETRGLVRLLNEWDPAIFIDTHTTNGCFHRYIITFEGPKTLAGHPAIIEFVRDALLPQVARDVQQRYHVPSFFYGDFNRAHTRWETYPALARYGTSYVGLRNRISILSEGYSYAPYKERVLGTRDFVKACLEYAAANKARIHKLLTDADRDTIAAGRQAAAVNRVALRCQALPAGQKVTAAGYVEEQKDGRTVATATPCDYEIELCNRYRPTLTVERPRAYVIPASLTTIVEKLNQHGIELHRLAREVESETEVYRIERMEFGKEPFQKHRLVTVEVSPRIEKRRFEPGTIVVRTDQKLGALAVYLLEPQSEDGLTTWNFFDEYLAAGGDFPVTRLTGDAQLPLEALNRAGE